MTKNLTIRNIDGVTHVVAKKSPLKRFKRVVRKSRSLQTVLLFVGLAIIVGSGILISNQVKAPNYDDVTTVTNALSKHVVLPKSEQPILATVTDKSALKTPFLKEADNGDRIIIYAKAKKVIIYRPSIDRIINIGPVDVDNIPKVTQ